MVSLHKRVLSVEPRVYSNCLSAVSIPVQPQVLAFTVGRGRFIAHDPFLGVGRSFCPSSRVTAIGMMLGKMYTLPSEIMFPFHLEGQGIHLCFLVELRRSAQARYLFRQGSPTVKGLIITLAGREDIVRLKWHVDVVGFAAFHAAA